MSSNGKKKTNKRTVTLLAVLAVILLLGGALAFLLLGGGGEGDNTSSVISDSEDAKYLITDKKAEDVKSVTVSNTKGTYNITKSGDSFTISSYLSDTGETVTIPSDVIFTSSAVKYVVDSLFSATITGTIENGADNLALYGLQDPFCKVDVAYADGSSFTFSIGNEAPDTTNYYVYNPATKEVGLIAKTSLTRLTVEKEDFVDLTLIPSQESNEQYFEKIVLAGTSRPEPIVLEPILKESDSSDDTAALISSGYQMVSPRQMEVDSNNATAVTTSPWGLQASDAIYIMPTEDQLVETGLAEPFSTLTLTFGGNTVELKLGNKNADGNYYCMTSKNNAIFIVNRGLVTWAEFKPFDLYYKLACVPNIKTVSAVTVEFDGKTHRFDLTHGEDDTLTVKYNSNKEMDSEIFRSYYQLLISAKGEYEAAEIPEDAAVQMKYTYEYLDKSQPSVVEFKQINDRRYAILLNGDVIYAVRAMYIDKVKTSLDQALAGEKVIITW